MTGKRLRLRPLSASEVYRVLREAGREDAIPQGRVITQGIAAASGFALGLKKGVSGTLLYDLISSNATQQYLNNLNLSEMFSGYNFTGNFNGLTSGFTNGLTDSIVLPTWNFSLPVFNFTLLCKFNRWNISSLNFGNCGNSNSAVQFSTQEICFNSRSLNDIESDDDDYNDANANDDYDYGNDESIGRQASPTTTTTGGITSPGNTGTVTDSFTQTGSGGTINCVVIQTPGRRHRRHR